MTRALLPQRRPTLDFVARAGEGPERRRHHLDDALDRVPRPLRISWPDHDLARNPTGNAQLTTHEVGERLSDRRGESVGQVATELLCVVALDRLRHDRFEVDVVGHRRVGFDLLIHLGHPQLADPVTDRVMHDRPDRRPATLDTVDQHEAPQRAGAIEWLLIELGGEVVQLPLGAGLGQAHVAHVEVDVEFGVGHPRRWRESAEAGNDSFVEARDLGDRPSHRATEVLRVDRAVQERERRTARVQPRILLHVPHEGFVVGHAVAEPCLAFSGFGHGRLASCRCVRCRCRAGDPTRPRDHRDTRAGTSVPTRPLSGSAARGPRRAAGRSAPS